MSRVRISEKGALGHGQYVRRGATPLAPHPKEWSPEFKRWLFNSYFRVFFSEPYGSDEGWIRVCSTLMRGSTITDEEGKRVILSMSAGDQECLDLARKLFDRDLGVKDLSTKK